MENRTMNTFAGPVSAGSDTVITLFDACPPDDAAHSPSGHGPVLKADAVSGSGQAAPEPKKKKSKFPINFDFLQKLGKVLMTVIAVMPAAGLMISVGKLVQMAGGDMNFVLTLGRTMETIGWAVINNLHILFAVAIGGSWAKERAGGAFAAVIAFVPVSYTHLAVYKRQRYRLPPAVTCSPSSAGAPAPVPCA